MYKVIKNLFVLACFVIPIASTFNATEYEAFLIRMSKDRVFFEQFEKNIQKALEIEPNYFAYTPFKSNSYKFECEKDSDPTIPTSVHKLRPQDIKVVGALGDSLTAALGADAETIIGLSWEYRGLSWSIGGDNSLEKVVTLPNILKKFNPNVYGFNTGKTFMLTTKQGKGLNVAVSGQEANHIPEQAQLLVDRLQSDSKVDYKNDWKMITLFIVIIT